MRFWKKRKEKKPKREDQGFKAFILRGNVVDLAVGVIIGAAFSNVVNSLVRNILTPLTSFVRLQISPTASVELPFGNRPPLLYGLFINDVISFVLLGLAVYYFVVKPVNKLMTLRKTETPVDSHTRECPFCLSSIPSAALKCAFCASEVG